MKHLAFLIFITTTLTSCEQIQNTLNSAFGNKKKSEKIKDQNINKDDFPSGRKISERISVWRKSDLDDWVNRNDES